MNKDRIIDIDCGTLKRETLMDNLIDKPKKRMNKKLKIIIAVIGLSIICSYIDVIFFSNNLYQGVTGASMLFFVRTLAEFIIFGFGIVFGMSINLVRSKK